MNPRVAQFQRPLSAHEHPEADNFEVSHAVGEWHRGLAKGVLALGVSLALVYELLALVPSTARFSPRLLSLHSLVLVHLSFMPGLAFSLGPVRYFSAFSTRDRRTSAVSLALYAIGATTAIGFACAGATGHGYRYFLGYFGAHPYLTSGVAAGCALIATAMGLNGWLWLTASHRSAENAPVSAFSELLSVAGFVQVVAVPFAWAIPVSMWLDKRGVHGLFSPALGGDPSRLAQLFWLYAQPVMLVAALPLLGIASDCANKALYRDDRATALPALKYAILGATLSYFIWGIRIEPALSDVTRTFYSFVALLGILLLGRPLFGVGIDLLRAWRRNQNLTVPLLSVAALSFGFMALIPLCLPALGLRLQSTAIETAQLHGFAGAVVLASVGTVSLAQVKTNRQFRTLFTAMAVAGACLMIGTELRAGMLGTNVAHLPASLGGLVLACSGLGALVLRARAQRLEHVRLAMEQLERDNAHASSERYPESNIA